MGSTSTASPSTTTTTAITTTTSPVTTTTAVKSCSPGWSRFGESCYWIYLERPYNYLKAREACLELGADLASSNSESENAFFSTLYNSYHFWLGGSDSATEGVWTWTDGTPFNYTHWYSGEGHGGVAENCLSINLQYGYGSWYDEKCYLEQYFICEINLS